MLNKILAAAALLSLLASCNSFNKKAPESMAKTAAAVPVNYGPLDTATFAGGCFWCVEGTFENLKGVKEAVSGYAGGHTANPTYEEVGSHTTGHAETVQFFYDPKVISFQTLLEVYFTSVDPTQVDGQGPDEGDSYRSVIFYHNAAQREQAEAYIKKLQGEYSEPITVSVEPYKGFYVAEAYHQNYEQLHPDNPYIRNVSKPRIEKVKKRFPELQKEKE